MRVFKERTNRQSLSILKEIPFSIEIHQGIPGTAHFRNGDECHIGCISCTNPRCMYFSDDEIECDRVEGFPNDKSINTCPVEALSWDNSSATPVIDSKKCINCGVCVSRCPVGALFFSDKGRLEINKVSTEYVESRRTDTTPQAVHLHQIEQLVRTPRAGVSLNASDQLFESIYDKLFRLKSNYHNAVGRSLLIALGCKCSMRRIGDVYTRMDAIYSSSAGSFGAVEIEFGKDTLDASRGILDDIAVLNTRYGVHKHDNKALVICLQLPNARQGYWQVVRDVKNVEGIKIGTITVGALMFLLWNGCIFEPEDDRYYIDYDNMDLRRILCIQVDCDDIPLSDKELGIAEPMK